MVLKKGDYRKNINFNLKSMKRLIDIKRKEVTYGALMLFIHLFGWFSSEHVTIMLIDICQDSYIFVCWDFYSLKGFIVTYLWSLPCFILSLLSLQAYFPRSVSSSTTDYGMYVCVYCSANEIEDEAHFLIKCDKLNNKREELFKLVS